MHTKALNLFRGAVLTGAVVLATPALAGGEAGELRLRDLGSKFVGYTTETQSNGSVNVLNPMFVQYLLPADQRHRFPIVMIHGGGGQGTDWLETPDGRDGWVDYFVADGWDVYVVDRPGHGRSQSNSSCNGMVGVANSAIISRLATSDDDVWPNGAPTPTNDVVISWTASGTTAPYCGDAVAAETISALLDEIGPAILLAHSAGGGSTFRVPDLNAEKVVGIIAFEAAGANPLAQGFGGGPPPIANWELQPPLPQNFAAVDQNGCASQGDNPSKLVNFASIPLVLVGSERGLNSGRENLQCQVAVWRQAGVDATAVYLPDRGLRGGGHFAMAQLDSADYADVFIELASEIEAEADSGEAGAAGLGSADAVRLEARLDSLEAESEIRRKLQAYMEVLGASDWDTYVTYFTHDGKLIMTEGTRVGREDIKERMSTAAARMAGAAQSGPIRRRADLLSNIEVDVDGHTATATSRFTFISENAEGGFEVAGSGLYVDEWALEEGEWRIAARTVDYDMLRGAPAPMPASAGR